MKITIIGPGAMGCLFAALLARKGKHEVWLLDKDAERAKRIEKDGITVEGIDNFKQLIKATSDAKRIGQSDLIIIFTKSYDTEKALKVIKPLLAENTYVMSLQNGLGNMQLISEAVGEDKTIGGITSHGATLLEEGRVRHSGKGETIIGKPNGKIFGDIRQISAIFSEAGIDTRVSKDIDGAIWSKLVINAGINTISAICHIPNGAILKSEGAKSLLQQAVSEAVKVAKRKRIKLIYDDMLGKAESVCSATSENICSMLQDVMRGKNTEADYINGAIIRHGKSCGIKTPANEMLLHLVKAVESTYKDKI